jgi:hypothetical protein
MVARFDVGLRAAMASCSLHGFRMLLLLLLLRAAGQRQRGIALFAQVAPLLTHRSNVLLFFLACLPVWMN